MKIVAVIQARMGSTRLPGKVLTDLAGEPVLARVVNRVGRCRNANEVVVATTTQPRDEPIVDLCQKNKWQFFRGSEIDVLDRYYQTARTFGADIIIRITSDCPLIEPEIIDLCVTELLNRCVDYVTTSWPLRTFPIGLDAEALSFPVLERIWKEDTNHLWREHVTPYIYFNPDKFSIHTVINPRNLSHMRWTIDTPEDLEFVRRIYDHFGHDRFSWREVGALLQKHPEWLEINKHIVQRTAPR